MADLSIPNAHARNIEAAPTAENLLATHLDIWTTAIEQKSSAGRGSSNKFSLYGIKKLRELILELAVRGKLVPQDANDEPASVLLERIAAEKAQLVKEGKLKQQKPLPEISDDEKPFEVPQGWVLCRFDNVIDQQFPISYGVLVPGNDVENGVPFVRIGDLDIKVPSSLPEKSISCEIDSKYERTRLLGGEILMAVVGSIGKLGVVPVSWKGANIARALCRIKPCESISKQYILILLQSRYMQESFMGDTRTLAQPTLNIGLIRTSLTPIPPLEEQHRIVAKVDELMLLCDALETQTEASIAAHQTLVEILLNALLLPQTAANTASQSDVSLEPSFTNSVVKDWQRVAEHFDTLFTTVASIDTLKQTIFQLAVMGKLVKQDPKDEPAAKLLERIAKEKALLIADKKIKKQKPLPAITDEEKPFELRRGWEWVKLSDISVLKGGFAFKSTLFIQNSNHQVIRMGNIRPDNLRLEENPVFIAPALAENTTDYEIMDGDILLTMTGTKGKRDYLYSALVDTANRNGKKLYLNQRLCALRGLYVSTEFVNISLKSDLLLNSIYAKSTGTANQANIGMEALNNWVLPLPPLEEQHRIVARVGELMALCDQLKVRLADAQTTQLYLTDAIVEQAL